MRDRLLQVVKDFLTIHYREGSPLLVGFSGGPDSLALLHLLLECRRFFDLEIHVAHVDHGWRESSEREAEALQKKIVALGLKFYLRRLEGVPATEEAAREARLAFFAELYEQLGCQAIILGHQGNDQIETVLKRILEGAALPAWGGIKTVTPMRGMQVWRPLLTVQKAELRGWLERRGLKAIEDETNSDPRYLRGRMRESILPSLEAQFGKQVGHNLMRFGQTAGELKEYLERRFHKYEKLVQEGGKADLSSEYPFEPVELKLFLKKFSENHGVFLSHGALETLYQLLEKGSSHRLVGSKGRWIEVRGRTIAIKTT